MNSGERILKTFKIIPGMPDRIPIQFELCRQQHMHFGKELNIPVSFTENKYEDVTYPISVNNLRLAMGSDVVVTGASVTDDYKILQDTNGHWLNEFGMKIKQGDIDGEAVNYPLAHAQFQTQIGLRLIEQGVDAIWGTRVFLFIELCKKPKKNREPKT